MTVKVLDCTLRDGGYVNLWNWGERNIRSIVHGLTESAIDFIELGFLKRVEYDVNKTLFNTVEEFNRFIPQAEASQTSYVGMITYGEYDLAQISDRRNGMVDGFRVIFKKPRWREALEYCKGIKEKGYKLFVNPMHTYSYTDRELLDLIDGINDLVPHAMSIVDTMGIMEPQQLRHTFSLIDTNLHSDSAVCFHSHNNLQQSFSCAQELLNLHSNREIIIDSSVQGIGRGAGNLCTELLLQYINNHCGKKYNLLPVLRIVDEQTNKIYAVKPWGYSVPYYLAASVKCHPNYASFLTDKASVSVERISKILALIPEAKKTNYDENLIRDLYLCYQKNEVDDRDTLEKLKRDIAQRKILLLASGGSIVRFRDSILSYIKAQSPFVVSLNFIPKDMAVDRVFISNERRYAEQKDLAKRNNILVTSNIIAKGVDTLNYGSYLNNSALPDNCALMFVKLLISLGVKALSLAGMDGFSGKKDDYFDVGMDNNMKLAEIDKRNRVMKEMLREFSEKINIHFLTPSLYEW